MNEVNTLAILAAKSSLLGDGKNLENTAARCKNEV